MNLFVRALIERKGWEFLRLRTVSLSHPFRKQSIMHALVLVLLYIKQHTKFEVHSFTN